MVLRTLIKLKRCSLCGIIIGPLCVWAVLWSSWSQDVTLLLSESPPPDPEPKVQPIDIVYMWVNGSDPDLLESIDRHVAMSELEKEPVGPQVKIISIEVLF